jgi:hypothetical protein
MVDCGAVGMAIATASHGDISGQNLFEALRRSGLEFTSLRRSEISLYIFVVFRFNPRFKSIFFRVLFSCLMVKCSCCFLQSCVGGCLVGSMFGCYNSFDL